MPGKASLLNVTLPMQTGDQVLRVEILNIGDAEAILFAEVTGLPSIPELPGITVQPSPTKVYTDVPISPSGSTILELGFSVTSQNYSIKIAYGHQENGMDVYDGTVFITLNSTIQPIPISPPPPAILPAIDNLLQTIRSWLQALRGG